MNFEANPAALRLANKVFMLMRSHTRTSPFSRRDEQPTCASCARGFLFLFSLSLFSYASAKWLDNYLNTVLINPLAPCSRRLPIFTIFLGASSVLWDVALESFYRFRVVDGCMNTFSLRTHAICVADVADYYRHTWNTCNLKHRVGYAAKKKSQYCVNS